jgi:hypothetical protein
MVETLISAMAIIGVVSILGFILKRAIVSLKELGLKEVKLVFESDKVNLPRSKTLPSTRKLRNSLNKTEKLNS